MGTPALACASLQTLIDVPSFEIAAVVTQPDRPKGRDLKRLPSPVKELALQRRIPVLQPDRARDEQFIGTLSQLQPELIAVAAYGQILPRSLLDLPRFGCLNVHTSLLPKYRGAAPIQWAILNDERETGVTIMKMDVGLDTGDIISQERTPILQEDDSQTLHDRLAGLGARLLVETIPGYVAGLRRPQPQPSEGISYARKIVRDDGRIDWALPAREIWNQIRALSPWPGAFTKLPGPPPLLLKIWRAEPVNASVPPGVIVSADKTGIVVGCGQNALRVLLLQREGARRLTPQEFLSGCPLQQGQHLGHSP
jgi:methionyl-tRNA formyltransferase